MHSRPRTVQFQSGLGVPFPSPPPGAQQQDLAVRALPLSLVGCSPSAPEFAMTAAATHQVVES